MIHTRRDIRDGPAGVGAAPRRRVVRADLRGCGPAARPAGRPGRSAATGRVRARGFPAGPDGPTRWSRRGRPRGRVRTRPGRARGTRRIRRRHRHGRDRRADTQGHRQRAHPADVPRVPGRHGLPRHRTPVLNRPNRARGCAAVTNCGLGRIGWGQFSAPRCDQAGLLAPASGEELAIERICLLTNAQSLARLGRRSPQVVASIELTVSW